MKLILFGVHAKPPGARHRFPCLLVLVVFGELERGAAQPAHDGPVLDLLGGELDAPGLGLARALGSYPPSAALRWLAWAVLALVLTAAVAGLGGGGQVNQERQPGGVDRGRHLGIA